MQQPTPRASIARFALSPVALVVASLLQPAAAHAQGDPEPSPQLKPSPLLRERIPQEVRGQLPTFVEGDRIEGRTELETRVEGDAVLRRGDTVVRARSIDYRQPDDLARAIGDVRINKAGNVFEGPELQLHLDAFEGFFNQPRYRFLRNDAYGEADRVDFIDEKHSVIHNASYTTCQRHPGPSWMPAWILRASSISIDEDEQVGEAKNAVLRFKGVPILPVPSLSFPLGDQRKSGFLPPTIGVDNVSGVETTIPYYWNIAPNRDATLYPTLMTRRGVDYAGEFRYLEPGYSGIVRGNFLPNDKLRDSDRWGFHIEHAQPQLQLPGLGPVGLTLNLNRVSDDNYWRDFSRSSASLTQRLLSNDANVSWAPLPEVAVSVRRLTWQTLQDPTAPIIPPYDRDPQVNAKYTRFGLPYGLETVVEGDFTRFVSDARLTNQPNANRAYALAQVSRTWQAPGWFVTPKAQLVTRRYDFDAPLANGKTSADVTVPIGSLDAGLVFERNTSYFGRAFLQTLEPRAFYVYAPYRNQNYLPNYDSGQNDFNFATIYTENSFGGYDRIADNNLLTLGATTRLLDPDTGAEGARFSLAQRLRFRDQQVVLPGQLAQTDRLSDTLFGASVGLFPKWALDTTIQYNFQTGQSIRTTFGTRYNPSSYHVLSVAYRRQQSVSEQVDIGWQWPLNDLWGDKGTAMGPGLGEGEGRWYSVGRMNLDLRDRKIVDSVLGLEYDGGCWVGRVVVERLQSSTSSSNKRILFQLEFVGLSSLGSNALQSLKQNIPRYQYLRERVTTPTSRFTNYD